MTKGFISILGIFVTVNRLRGETTVSEVVTTSTSDSIIISNTYGQDNKSSTTEKITTMVFDNDEIKDEIKDITTEVPDTVRENILKMFTNLLNADIVRNSNVSDDITLFTTPMTTPSGSRIKASNIKVDPTTVYEIISKTEAKATSEKEAVTDMANASTENMDIEPTTQIIIENNGTDGGAIETTTAANETLGDIVQSATVTRGFNEGHTTLIDPSITTFVATEFLEESTTEIYEPSSEIKNEYSTHIEEDNNKESTTEKEFSKYEYENLIRKEDEEWEKSTFSPSAAKREELHMAGDNIHSVTEESYKESATSIQYTQDFTTSTEEYTANINPFNKVIAKKDKEWFYPVARVPTPLYSIVQDFSDGAISDGQQSSSQTQFPWIFPKWIGPGKLQNPHQNPRLIQF